MGLMKTINKGAETFVSYTLLQLIGKPWIEWDAYKVGIIDERGKVLRKSKTREERDIMGPITILALNFKKSLIINPVFYSMITISPMLAMREEFEKFHDAEYAELLSEMVTGDSSGDATDQAAGKTSGNIVVTSSDNVDDKKKESKRKRIADALDKKSKEVDDAEPDEETEEEE